MAKTQIKFKQLAVDTDDFAADSGKLSIKNDAIRTVMIQDDQVTLAKLVDVGSGAADKGVLLGNNSNADATVGEILYQNSGTFTGVTDQLADSAVIKAYIDDVTSAGVYWKEPVDAASEANVVTSVQAAQSLTFKASPQVVSIDGQNINTLGKRILLAGQTDGEDKGIWEIDREAKGGVGTVKFHNDTPANYNNGRLEIRGKGNSNPTSTYEFSDQASTIRYERATAGKIEIDLAGYAQNNANTTCTLVFFGKDASGAQVWPASNKKFRIIIDASNTAVPGAFTDAGGFLTATFGNQVGDAAATETAVRGLLAIADNTLFDVGQASDKQIFLESGQAGGSGNPGANKARLDSIVLDVEVEQVAKGSSFSQATMITAVQPSGNYKIDINGLSDGDAIAQRFVDAGNDAGLGAGVKLSPHPDITFSRVDDIVSLQDQLFATGETLGEIVSRNPANETVFTASNGSSSVVASFAAETLLRAKRPSDANTNASLPHASVWVKAGTLHGDNAYVQTVDSITVGTTSQTWSQFGSAPAMTGGDGITIGTGASSNQISISDNALLEQKIKTASLLITVSSSSNEYQSLADNQSYTAGQITNILGSGMTMVFLNGVMMRKASSAANARDNGQDGEYFLDIGTHADTLDVGDNDLAGDNHMYIYYEADLVTDGDIIEVRYLDVK